MFIIDEKLSPQCQAFLRAREMPRETGPEPTIWYSGPLTIRAACKLMLDRKDLVPKGYYPGLPEEQPTYAEAADDLLASLDYHAERLEQIACHREAIETLTTSM